MGRKKKSFSWSDLVKIDWVLVGLMGFGVVLLIWGGVGNLIGGDDVEVEYMETDEKGGDSIWIDISGAVKKAGVYELKRGARIKDALVLAGGMSEEADREFVSIVLNLAEEIEDGEKIYIPPKSINGEEIGKVAGVKKDGLININEASIGELDTLWGIGSVRAEEIVKGRPYRKTEELLERKIIPANVYEKNEDHLSVY